jgi:hypothetical protein
MSRIPTTRNIMCHVGSAKYRSGELVMKKADNTHNKWKNKPPPKQTMNGKREVNNRSLRLIFSNGFTQ